MVAFGDTEHERLVAALKASRCGTWRWNIAEDVVEWDEAICEVYGIPPAKAPKTSREFVALVHPDDREPVWVKIRECIENGTDADFQFRAVGGDRVLWIHDRGALVRDAHGKPAYMIGACFDVTERRRVEEERDLALEKQKLLLKELSHRVKNHLTLIIALLRLKGSRQKDPAARQDFERAIERINTIADLHEQLYRTGDVESVDVQAYLGGICDNLQQSVLAESKIRIVRELEPFALHVDQAVPVGLILNELITNAVKYAFAPGEDGRILVRFRKRDARATLTVSDNGRGLDRSNAPPGVGTRMVRTLGQQIGARVRTVSRHGVICSLTFSVPA
jgi:PAS domain S-box-containing protein